MKEENTKNYEWASLITLVIATVLLSIANIILWVNFSLLNTDRFVRIMQSVATNPAFQTTLSNYITDTTFNNLNTTEIIRRVFPQQSDLIIGILNNALKNLSKEITLSAIESQQFVQIWNTAIQVTHQQVTRLLLGEGRITALQNGQVAINFDNAITTIKDRLNERGMTELANNFPQVNYEYVLFTAPNLAKIQPYVQLAAGASPWIYLLVAAFYSLSLWLTKRFTHTLNLIGIGMIVGMVITGIFILIIRSDFINSIAITNPYFTPEIASIFFDALLSPLWIQILLLSLVGVAVISYSRRMEQKKVE